MVFVPYGTVTAVLWCLKPLMCRCAETTLYIIYVFAYVFTTAACINLTTVLFKRVFCPALRLRWGPFIDKTAWSFSSFRSTWVFLLMMFIRSSLQKSSSPGRWQGLLAHAALLRSLSMGLGLLANPRDLRTGRSGGVSCIILQCEGENNGMTGRRTGGSHFHDTLWFSLSAGHVLSNCLFLGIYLPVHVLSYFRPLKGVGLMSRFLRRLFHLPAGSLLFCH